MFRKIKEYLFPMSENRRIIELLEEIREVQRKNSYFLEEILRILYRPRYAVKITQESPAMAPVNGVVLGATGKFLAQLQDNGSPIALPSGSTWSWSSSDTTVTIAPDASDTTGGTVDVTVPAGDAGTSFVLTAETVDPTGTKVQGVLTVPILPVPQKFTVSVSQLS